VESGLAVDALEEARVDPKRANVLYHDAAARSYDGKWAIGFDQRCLTHVRDRAGRMLPNFRYERVLDVGVGTGFFILNLWQAGFVGRPYACDLSTGMLAVCAESARALGCDIELRVADVEDLPYEDRSFDLVVGHAVLHHLPHPDRALAEIHRVLVPGGDLLIAGEPTRLGDRMAKATGRLTARAVRSARRYVPSLGPPVRPDPATEDERIMRALEWDVDLHTFQPAELARSLGRAGFERIRVETEELASSLVGWAVRTVEAEVPAGRLGTAWASAAYRTYLALYALDQRILYRVLPKALFYNVLGYGRRPAGAEGDRHV
jgi:ubiquinone/menaquinone biosynthesis C-methylase UbiE